MTSWRDVLPIHPAAELFPLMSEAELRELGEDIRKHMLQNSVVLWTDGDGKEWLLDGRNRLDAMERAGLFTVNDDGEFESEKGGCLDIFEHENSRFISDPYVYVATVNLHRRHLTAEQKRELIATLLKATPEKSDRQIAETVKADHKTVASVRAEKQATGEIPQLEKTIGKDGKARKVPALKARRSSEAIARERFRGNLSYTLTVCESVASVPIPEISTEEAQQANAQVDEAIENLRKWKACIEPVESNPIIHDDREPDVVRLCSNLSSQITTTARKLSNEDRVEFLDSLRHTIASIEEEYGNEHVGRDLEWDALCEQAAQKISPDDLDSNGIPKFLSRTTEKAS